MPLTGDTLERPVAAIREAQTGAGDQIPYRAGHQNFVRTRERGNTRADMDRDATDILAHHLAFAGVETGTDFNSKLTDFVADSAQAQRTPRAGPSKVARIPSPVLLTS